MVKGRLQIKKGYYYAVLSYKQMDGKRKEIWRATKIRIGENRKKAEIICDEYKTQLLAEIRLFKEGYPYLKKKQNPNKYQSEEILFGDYLDCWLNIIKNYVADITFSAYKCTVQSRIKPYFIEKGIRLTELTANDISLFYIKSLQKVSAHTIKHYHAIIRQAVNYAYENNLLLCNVADRVRLPKIEPYIGDYYNADELKKLFEVVEGKRIEFPVLMAAYYGLRRSEIVGLKWSAIDFCYKTISIRHTVTEFSFDGKVQTQAKNGGKTVSSIRTLPLFPIIEEFLFKLKETQAENRDIYKDYYNKNNDYIYVDELGNLIRPGFITQSFPIILRNTGLRHIRFQDLRHSCATLLRHNGARMEDIQKWLGHSSITTTEKVYAHFEDKELLGCAEKIENALIIKM